MLPVIDIANTYGVNMGINRDNLVPTAHPADDIAQAIDLYLVIAKLLHLSLNAHNDFLLPAALAGVGNHSPQEGAHIGLIPLRRCFDRFEIHNKIPPS